MRARLLFLLLSAAVLLAARKIAATEETSLPPAAYQPMEPVTIAVAADLHYLSPALTDHGAVFQRVIENADGKVTEYAEELLEAFTKQTIAQSPDVLLLAGDLTFNGERASHEALAQKLRRSALLNDGFQMENAAALTALYQKYGVLCSLAGHLHIQHIASRQSFTEILTFSLAVAPNQYGVLTVTEDSADYHTVPVDVSAWAAAQGRDKAALLPFENYAADFFYSTAYRQAAAALADAPDAAAMADYFAGVNAAYFAGRMDRVPNNAELLKRWKKQDFFLAAYLQSMTTDFGTDFTQYHFTGGTP